MIAAHLNRIGQIFEQGIVFIYLLQNTAMSMQMPSRFRRSMVSDVSFNSLSAFSACFKMFFILTVLVSCPSGLLPCAACIAFALVQVVESSYDVDVHEEEVVGDEQELVLYLFGRQIVTPQAEDVKTANSREKLPGRLAGS